MKGIDYIVDKRGKKKAVVVNLKVHGAAWEDFYDNLIADMRVQEPRTSFTSLKMKLQKKGKLRASV